MEVQRNEWLPQRKFGCLKIVWEIENSFCVTYQKKWEICSPMFIVNGFVSIKWRFILTASKDDGDAEYLASINLERHETSDITLPVRVFWKLSCEIGNIIICEKEGIFNTNGILVSRIKNFDKLQETLQDISTRKFNIEAIFLVTRLQDSVAYETSNDVGLRTLSHDISKLFNFKGYSDLTFITSCNTSVKGHKAILSVGSRLLNDLINHKGESNSIFVAYPDEKSARKIFGYLYTGNLNYVLRMPSNSINEAINFFKIKELEKYYMKDELILRTKHEAREFYHKWIITDIPPPRGVDSLFSSHFGDSDLNISFRLHLGLNEVNNGGCIGIFLEGSIPPEWQELYIEFEIVDISSYSTNLRKAVRWSVENGGPPGIEDFLSIDIFKAISVTCNNTLSVSCSLFTPNYVTSLSVVSMRNCLLSYINYEKHYTLLSKRIKSLYETGKYSDLTIICGDENFRVHKSILSARSPVFAKVISSPENSTVISLKDIDPVILRIFFRYVYSGVLENWDLSVAYKIYDAAVQFGMVILRYRSVKMLVDNLHISNVFDTVFVAHAHKEVQLKLEAFKFLVYNKSEIRKQDKWEKFTNETDLYEEFKEYVRIHIRNNPEGGLNLDDF